MSVQELSNHQIQEWPLISTTSLQLQIHSDALLQHLVPNLASVENIVSFMVFSVKNDSGLSKSDFILRDQQHLTWCHIFLFCIHQPVGREMLFGPASSNQWELFAGAVYILCSLCLDVSFAPYELNSSWQSLQTLSESTEYKGLKSPNTKLRLTPFNSIKTRKAA